MRTEWLAVSAAALVIGATALFFGAYLTPPPSGDGKVFALVSAEPDLWITVSVVCFVAAFGLLVGISCVGPLIRRRGFGLGALAMGLIAFAAIVLAGFAMQLVLLRALSVEGGVTSAQLVDAMQDPLQKLLLFSGFAAFYLGEVLLAWALLLARTTPRWVAYAFLAHVALVLLRTAFGVDAFEDAPVVLMVAAFAGVAISANRADVAARNNGHARRRVTEV